MSDSLAFHGRQAIAAALVAAIALFACLIGAARSEAAFVAPGFNVAATPTQAAGHPKLTTMIDVDAVKADQSGDDVSELSVEAPAGLELSQSAVTTKCTDTQLTTSKCPSASYVGTLSVKWRTSSGGSLTTSGNVHVMVTPAAPNAARLGVLLKASGYKSFAVDLRVANAIPASAPTSITVSSIKRSLQRSLWGSTNVTLDAVTLNLNAKANSSQSGPYFTRNPSSCGSNASTARLTSYANESVSSSSSFATTGCAAVPFTPSSSVTPTGADPVAATGLTANVGVPSAASAIQHSTVAGIDIALPADVEISSDANALDLCNAGQLASNSCPASSAVGQTSFTYPGAPPAWSGQLFLIDRAGDALTLASAGASPSQWRIETAGTIHVSSSSLPHAAWSNATLTLNSSLLKNNCPSGNAITSITAESAATVVSSSPWTVGDCGPEPETTITSAPAALSNVQSPAVDFTSDVAGASFTCAWDDAPAVSCEPPAAPSEPLLDGDHTICVRAATQYRSDPTPACASFVVDTTPPTVTIETPVAGAIVIDPVWIAFSISDASPIANVTCEYNAAPATTCSSPWLVPNPVEGPNTVTVCATDAAGNAGCASRVFTTEIEPPPPPTITSGPIGVVASSSASFTFDGGSSSDSNQCSLDGGAWSMCSSPTSLTGLANGTHTFCVRIVTAAGGVGSSSCRTWTVDTIPPPAPTITSAPSSTTTSTSATFAFTGEQGAAFECSLDGSPWTSCASPKVYNPLSHGLHTFCVRAIDLAGNVGPGTCRSWNISGPPPSVTITSGPTGLVSSRNATFTFSTSGGDVTLECSLDGGPWQACSSPITFGALSDGAHTFCVRAKDFAGNVGPVTCRTWTIDATPPPPPVVLNGPNNPSSSKSATFVFTGAEAGNAYECQLDTAPWTSCSSPAAYSGLTEGAHTFCVRARDAAGNVGPSICRTWVVDTVPPPPPMITSGPPSPTNSTTATFAFTGEAGADFSCQLNGGSWMPCTNPVTFSGLAENLHSFCLRAIDLAGNMTGPICRSWIVDLTPPPAPVISYGPPSPTSNAAAAFAFSGESGAYFECMLDGGVWATCNPPAQYSGLPDGSHTFCVRARDVAGNSGGTTCWTWVIDTTPPPVPTITSAPPSPSNNTTASYGFTGEAGASFECQLGGSPWAPCTSPASFTGLSDGAQYFCVRARDAVWNMSNQTCVTTVIDTTPPVAPTVTRTNPTADPTGSSSQTIAILGSEPGLTLQGSLDGAPFSTVSSPVNLTGLPYGNHVYSVRAIDTAGNIGSAASVTWTILVIDYFLTIDSGPSGTTNSTSATFTFYGAPPGSIYQCQLDGSAPQACNSPKSYPIIYPGTHSFCVSAIAPDGSHYGPVCRNWQVTQPPTPLSVWIATGPPATTVDNTPTFGYQLSEPAYGMPPCPPGQTCVQVIQDFVQMRCIVDNGSPQGCPMTGATTGSFTTQPLAVGDHTFCVRATRLADGTVAQDCRSFEVINDSVPSASVTISSPAPGQTTETQVTLDYAMQGFAGTVTCDRPVGSKLHLSLGDNTISVACWDDQNNFGSDSVVVTRVSNGSFEPTFDQTHVVGGDNSTGLVITLGSPAGSDTIASAVIKEHPAIQPNYPAFGARAEQCPMSSVVINGSAPNFNSSGCPGAALVGSATLSSPDFNEEIHGRIYMVDSVPLPWFGVEFDPSSDGSILGSMLLRTTLQQVDPNCDPETDPMGCVRRVVIEVLGSPDASQLTATFDLSELRPAGGGTPTHMFRFENQACDTISHSAELTSIAGATATRYTPLFLPPC